MNEIDIKIDKYTKLRFVFENDEWVCRANDEFIQDLKKYLDYCSQEKIDCDKSKTSGVHPEFGVE